MFFRKNIFMWMLFISLCSTNCQIIWSQSTEDTNFDNRWVPRPPLDKEFPYAVLILMSKATDKICSGTLIAAGWVLTAARCMYDRRGRVVEDNQSLTVIAGYDGNISDVHIQRRESLKLKILPLPSKKNYYSLALIEIDPFESDFQGKRTEPLPLNNVGYYGIEEQTCKSGSYGLLTWGEPKLENSQLKKYVSKATYCNCSEQMKDKFPEAETQNWICAKHIYNLGVCSGDFGAALVCDATLLAVAVGIVRLSGPNDACNITRRQFHDCQKTSRQSIYIQVCYYLQWIHNYVPSVALNTTPCDYKGLATTVHLRSHIIDVVIVFISLVFSTSTLLLC